MVETCFVEKSTKKSNDNLIIRVFSLSWLNSRGAYCGAGHICHECKGMLTFTDRNFAGKLHHRGIVSRIVQLRIRAMYWHVPLLFSFFFSAWWIRDGNSSPRARKFLFSVPFIPHFSSSLLPLSRPQGRGVKNSKNEKLPKRIKRPGRKNSANRGPTITKSHLRVREISKIERIKKVVIAESFGWVRNRIVKNLSKSFSAL